MSTANLNQSLDSRFSRLNESLEGRRSDIRSPWPDNPKRPDVTCTHRPSPAAWTSAIEAAEVARLALRYLRQELQRCGGADRQALVTQINEAEQLLAPLAQCMRRQQA